MYKKIMLAADGSEHSLRAANQAINLAKGNEEAVVEIVYVVDNANAKTEVLHNWNKLNTTDKQREKLNSAEEKVKEAGVSYSIKVLKGEPGPKLVEYANENGFDLVVIGSRGLNSLQEMVLGSVSHKIAKRVNCPVLIVK